MKWREFLPLIDRAKGHKNLTLIDWDQDHNNLKITDWDQDHNNLKIIHNNLTHNLWKAKDTEQRFNYIMTVDRNTLNEESMNYNEKQILSNMQGKANSTVHDI
jgi:hypothetical protein